jgi:hypothetical protein
MKKLLALVLAMVMTLGLATVGASAAAYTDADSIDFKEAVEVMSALKVFDGQNGAFNPNGILTREQGAKIIAYMILGKSAADSLTTAKSSFADVAPERWSAGAIEYCVSTKIVGGAGKDANGNDVFNPEAELTGYAFAKMCLVALGYNPNYENFVGGDWAINVAKCAADAGLDKDLASLVMSKGITREQAAQMALNTEKATMVDYKNPINVKGSDGMEVTVNAERSNVGNGTYNYKWNNGADGSVDALYTQFIERYNQSPKVYLNSGDDDFGRPANIWKQGNANIGKYAKTPTVTYTAGVKGGTVYSDLGGSSIAWSDMYKDGNTNDKFSYVVDGKKDTNYGPASAYTTGDVSAIIARSQTSTDLPGSGKGVLTEIFYDRNDSTLHIIQTRTYLAKANAAYDATRKSLNVAVQSNKGDASVSAITSIDGNDFPVVEGAAKDAYFYITATTDGAKATVKTVTPVAADRFLSGVTLSSKSSSSMVADGTSYSVAANSAVVASDLDLQSTKYDFVLDPYGYVLASSQTSGSTEYKDKYIYVFNAGALGMSAQAEIVKMDGTSATITVSKTKGSSAAPAATVGTTNVKDKDNVDEAARAGANVSGHLVSGVFYTYSQNDDNTYTLTYAGTYSVSGDVTKNLPSQAAWGGYTANSKTAFVVNSTNTSTGNLSAYLGIANFPGATKTGDSVFVRDGGTVAAVYIYGNASDSTTDKYVYLFSGPTTAKDSSTSGDYYLYDAFIDGAKSADKVAVDSGNGGTPGLYKVSYNSKGRLTAADGTAIGGNTTGIGDNTYGAWTDAYLRAGNGNITVVKHSGPVASVYTLASDAEFYYVSNYNTNDSVTYTDASAAAARTTSNSSLSYKVVVLTKSTSDPSISKVWIITNNSTNDAW